MHLNYFLGHGISGRRRSTDRRIQKFNRLSISFTSLQRRFIAFDSSRFNVLQRKRRNAQRLFDLAIQFQILPNVSAFFKFIYFLYVHTKCYVSNFNLHFTPVARFFCNIASKLRISNFAKCFISG
jgi:hypothetical protein